MHELGLVNYVVREVSRIAEENQVRKLHSVTLEFGEVSGIVPSYLHSYWDWYTKKFPLFEGTELICETVPAITWCDDCKKPTPPWNTAKPVLTAAAAAPGCCRGTR